MLDALHTQSKRRVILGITAAAALTGAAFLALAAPAGAEDSDATTTASPTPEADDALETADKKSADGKSDGKTDAKGNDDEASPEADEEPDLDCGKKEACVTIVKTLVDAISGATLDVPGFTFEVTASVSGNDSVTKTATSGEVNTFYDTTGQWVRFVETAPGDYTLTSATCERVKPNGGGTSFTLGINGKTAFTESNGLTGSGHNFTCTFLNKTTSSLEVTKSVPNGPQGVTPSDFHLDAGTGGAGTGTIARHVVAAGSYTVTESLVAGSDSPPLGAYDKSYSCTITNPITDKTRETEGTITEGSSFPVTVGVGEHASCTLTNTWVPTTLTLAKDLKKGAGDNRNPGDFNLSVDTGSRTVTGISGSATVTTIPVPYGTSLPLSEAFVDSNQGDLTTQYDSSWSCTGGALTGSSVTLERGANATCTVTNTPIGPKLTLVKEAYVMKDGSPPTPMPDIAELFGLSATNPAEPSDGISNATTGTPGATDQEVNANVSYALTETGGDPRFTLDGWECTNGDGEDKTVTLTLGEDVTCTATNSAEAPTLTLHKETWVETSTAAPTRPDRWEVPDDAEGWSLAATSDDTSDRVEGTTDESGTFDGKQVDPGTYTLAEPGAADSPYELESWRCATRMGEPITVADASITLAYNQTVTCTAVNVAAAPSLTLVKELEDAEGEPLADDAATAAIETFTLTAKGAIGSPTESTAFKSGQTEDLYPGSYELSESTTDPARWVQGSEWTCTAGKESVPLDEGAVTLAPGDDVTCTITNTEASATILLKKEFTDADLGNAADWDLTFTPTTGTSVTMNGAGTTPAGAPTGTEITLTEASKHEDHYELIEWTCVNGKPGGAKRDVEATDTGEEKTYTLPALADGDAITCTALNKPKAKPSITVAKQLFVEQAPSDRRPVAGWSFTVGGTSVTTGTDGSARVGFDSIHHESVVLSETLVAGYEFTSAQCFDASGNEVPGELEPQSGTLTLAEPFDSAGTAITCTFANKAPGPQIVLSKDLPGLEVTEDELATERAKFELTATGSGGAPLTFGGGSDSTWKSGDWQPLTVGTEYTLGETDSVLSRLYEHGDWTCEQGSTRTPTGEFSTMELEDAATPALTAGMEDLFRCVKKNHHNPASLTLTKDPQDPTGVTDAVAADWQLWAEPVGLDDGAGGLLGPLADRTVFASGETKPAIAVEYQLGETLLSERLAGLFAPVGWECTGEGVELDSKTNIVRLTHGSKASCTLTNTASSVPTLTLGKVALLDGEEMADVASTYTLTATGTGETPTGTGETPTVVSGTTGTKAVTEVPVMPGEFTLSESGGDPTYQLQGWACGDAKDPAWSSTGPTVSVTPGRSISCVATNVFETVPEAGAALFGVGDLVWHDANANGRQDPGEAGVPGVVVTALTPDGAPALDANGAVARTTTDTQGTYLLHSLPEGTYRLGFESVPTAMSFTVPQAAGVPAALASVVDPDLGVSAPFELSETAPAMVVTPPEMEAAGVQADLVDLTRDAGLVDEVELRMDQALPDGGAMPPPGDFRSDATAAVGRDGDLPQTGASTLVSLATLAALFLAAGAVALGLRAVRAHRS